MAEEQRCSKCYRDLRIVKEQHASSANTAVENSFLPSSSSPPLSSLPSSVKKSASPAKEENERQQQKKKAGRCGECMKSVGLVRFTCRCGASYCGAHRYPEKHRCTFDFKAAGREEIARANPLVVRDKLEGRI